ncbi:thiamine ABC transporter substrate binding subunit [Halorubrum gandharaense]
MDDLTDEPGKDSTRRRFLAATGAVGAVGLAGCTAEQTDDEETPTEAPDDGDEDDENGADADTEEPETPTLTVATYSTFVDGDSPPGPWLKEAFEETHDAEIEFAAPDNGVNHYVEQANAGVDIDADVYVGLYPDDLARIAGETDDPLFEAGGLADVAGAEDVREGLHFDPHDRVVPTATNYISLVYDGTETDAPETFEGLLDEEHAGDLITQNPGDSTTGRAFLLHTIDAFGDDGDDDYLDYWADLQDNDVRVLGSWDDAYAAWEGGEAPMVVSYSTDQVFANMEGADLEEHQIRFVNGQAYANPEGAALFADADEPELAREFVEFLLTPEAQGRIAELNVQFPATETADLPDDYAELAHEPEEAVTFSYEELEANLDEWVEDWERQFAGN